MGKLNKWSTKRKFEIALCTLTGDMTINEICQRYQVSPSQVYQWKKQLHEKIGQLTVERDYLKKSVSGQDIPFMDTVASPKSLRQKV